MPNSTNNCIGFNDPDEALRGAEGFGQRVRGRREKLGIAQQELARKVGVSLTTIQNYEGGQLPKGEHAIMLAFALGMSLDELLIGGPRVASAVSVPVAESVASPMPLASPVPLAPPPLATPHGAFLSGVTPQGAPHTLPPCPRCAELEAELRLERAERRELSAENRHSTAKIEQLLRENSELRVLCTKLEGHWAPDGAFSKQTSALSNNTLLEG